MNKKIVLIGISLLFFATLGFANYVLPPAPNPPNFTHSIDGAIYVPAEIQKTVFPWYLRYFNRFSEVGF